MHSELNHALSTHLQYLLLWHFIPKIGGNIRSLSYPFDVETLYIDFTKMQIVEQCYSINLIMKFIINVIEIALETGWYNIYTLKRLVGMGCGLMNKWCIRSWVWCYRLSWGEQVKWWKWSCPWRTLCDEVSGGSLGVYIWGGDKFIIGYYYMTLI